MPRDDEHAAKARRNEVFAESLDRSDQTREEWAVTSAFYSALHYVQGYFVKIGVSEECHDHKARLVEIARDTKLKYILGEYTHLQKLSQLARYKCVGLPQNPYSEARARLEKIKRQVASALAS